MNWKFTGDRPVYQQIMAAIRGAILTGELATGSKVPSVRDLAAQAQVNPNTMQRALTELEQEGLLISSGTLGRFVTSDDKIIGAIRQDAIDRTVKECAEKFRAVGVSMEEAGKLLSQLKEDV